MVQQNHGISSYSKKIMALPTRFPMCSFKSVGWWDWFFGKPRPTPNDIPIVPGHKLWGSFPEYVEQGVFKFITQAAKLYPNAPIIQINMPAKTLYLINDRELTKEVLKRHTHFVRGKDFGPIRLIVGEDGLTETDTQKANRDQLYGYINPHKLSEFEESMNKVVESKITDWKTKLKSVEEGQPGQVSISAQKEMGVLIAQIIGRSLFDSDWTEYKKEIEQAIADLDTVLQAQTASILDPTVNIKLSCFPECCSHVKQAAKRYHDFFKKVVKDYQQKIEREGANETYMSKTLSKFGEGPTIDKIKSIFQAGVDTSSKVLAWSLYELAKHPEISKKLQEEIDTHIREGSVTMEQLKTMPKLIQFLDETLRMWPAFFATIRNVAASDSPVTLGEQGMYPLEPGATVVLSPYLMHHHPKLWENPDTFDPQKHFPDTKEGQHAWQESSAFMPFIEGRHKCPGRYFATADIKMTLAHILRNFNVSLTDPDHIPEPHINVTMGPLKDIPITLTER